MPYFAADSRAAAVPQPVFTITRQSDSLKKPYKKAAPGDSGRGTGPIPRVEGASPPMNDCVLE